jgi:hypothetical protein
LTGPLYKTASNPSVGDAKNSFNFKVLILTPVSLLDDILVLVAGWLFANPHLYRSIISRIYQYQINYAGSEIIFTKGTTGLKNYGLG